MEEQNSYIGADPLSILPLAQNQAGKKPVERSSPYGVLGQRVRFTQCQIVAKINTLTTGTCGRPSPFGAVVGAVEMPWLAHTAPVGVATAPRPTKESAFRWGNGE